MTPLDLPAADTDPADVRTWVEQRAARSLERVDRLADRLRDEPPADPAAGSVGAETRFETTIRRLMTSLHSATPAPGSEHQRTSVQERLNNTAQLMMPTRE